MPRAKKKKIAVAEVVEETKSDDEPEAEPPPPPSPPRKPTKVLAPESPSKSVLLRTQQQTRRTVNRAIKKAEAIDAKAEADLTTAQLRFARNVQDLLPVLPQSC